METQKGMNLGIERRRFLKTASVAIAGLASPIELLHSFTDGSTFAAPAGAEMVRHARKEWLRTPLMFSNEPYNFSLGMERVDVARTCQQIAESSGTVYRLTATSNRGCYTYFDTKFGFKDPRLGSQDWLADAREGCHRYNLKLLTYFGLSAYYSDHPDFGKYDKKDEQGRPLHQGTNVGLRIPCLNWSAWHDKCLAIIDEVVRKYSPDGIYFDWGGYDTCYCEQCRKRYQAERGKPIPDSRTLPTAADYEGESLIADPDAREYIAWKQDLTTKLVKDISDNAHAAKPDIAVIRHSHPTDQTMQYYPATLTEGGERSRPDKVWRTGLISTASNVYPFPTFINLYNYLCPPDAEYRLRAAQVLAAGCYPNVIPIPPVDATTLPAVAEILRVVAKNPSYFDFNLNDCVRFVALTNATLAFGLVRDRLVGRKNPIGVDGVLGTAGQKVESDNAVRGWPAIEVDRFNSSRAGMYGAMALSSIPVRGVEREHFLQQFSGYKVLCLANESAMSDAEVKRVREFVAGGGGLIATYETSLYREDGSKRDDFGLADVLGVHYAARDRYLGVSGGYRFHFQTTERHPVNGDLFLGQKIRNLELVVPVRLDGAKVIATANQTSETSVFEDSRGGSLGAGERDAMRSGPSINPAVTVHQFGAGRVVYFSGRPDSMFLHWAIPETRMWLRNAVQWVSGGSLPVELTGDVPVSASLFQQPQRYVLHLVNLSVTATPVDRVPALHNIPVLVRIPAGVDIRGVRALVAGKDIQFQREKDGISFLVPQLHEYEVVGLERS